MKVQTGIAERAKDVTIEEARRQAGNRAIGLPGHQGLTSSKKERKQMASVLVW